MNAGLPARMPPLPGRCALCCWRLRWRGDTVPKPLALQAFKKSLPAHLFMARNGTKYRVERAYSE